MPFRNITLPELARRIGMDARELKRLADRGDLPGQYIGGQWRFNLAQMQDWLQHHLHALDDRHLHNLEQATSDDPSQSTVANILPLEGIDLSLPAKSRASVLRNLADLAERTGLLWDRAGLIEALEEREALRPTALPKGIAFPHPRRSLAYATSEPMVCIARVPAGVPYGAPDGRLTDLFVLVVSHDDRQHLHVLARLSMMFSTDLPDLIRAAESPSEVLTHIIDAERALLAKRSSAR